MEGGRGNYLRVHRKHVLRPRNHVPGVQGTRAALEDELRDDRCWRQPWVEKLTSIEQAGSPSPSARLHAKEFLKTPHGDEGHRPDLHHLDMPLLDQHVEL